MGEIVLLDELTINKIAAGEVVDRPASIVKELIENSIDAGAKNITVDIKNGGISYIKIKDDGYGFKSDDVEIAFERHATSKIRSEEDIQKVMSMGFRGEALASIAAISNVELVTKNINEEIGTKTVVEAGRIISSEEFASTQGTSITVRNIFFNVPARYKFLKKDYTEAGYIEEAIIRQALVHPEISFKFNNNGKNVISTTGSGDLKTVIYNIFGKDSANNIINVESEYSGIKVKGIVGTPTNVRSNRSHQYFYVNSRFVKNKTLSTAIDEGYSQNIAIGKFSFCVLNVEVSPESIDVNVHPAKLEIKFENESLIFSAVYNAVKSAILKYNTETSPFSKLSDLEERIEIKSDDVIKNIVQEIKKEEYSPIEYIETNFLPKQVEDINSYNHPQEKVETVEKSSENNEFIPVNKDISKTEELYIEKPKEEILYKYRGTIFNTYPIVEIGEKIYIVDQHAAHERLLYEQIKQIYYSKEKATQMLLLPILVELTSFEMSIYLENKVVFENSGFVIENFGDNALKIVGVPNINYDIDYNKMFLDILDQINGTNKTEQREKEERFLATVACKAAIKANTTYTETEYKYLIDQMMKLNRPFTCPHGRPTAYELTKYEIERKFLRK